MTATNPNPALAPEGTNGLRDIRPPVAIPTGWEWVFWLAAVLAMVALAWWLWRWWNKRRMRQEAVPIVPPHIRARRRLEAALQYLSDPREFCIRVSDALRAYLEERFEFRAPERTTEEFLYELQATDLLNQTQKLSLSDFLQRCDLVKFARYEPAEPELRDLHASALRLVNETEPVPAPVAPGAHAQEEAKAS